MSKTVWHLLKTTCYGPLAIHTICKYDFICATLYNFFVLVHNTSENTILFLATFDLQRTLFEQCFFFSEEKKQKKQTKEKRKMISSFLSTVMGSLNAEAVWDAVCPQEDHRLWIWFNIRIPPSWQVSQQTCGHGAEVKGRLSANPTTQPLTDCSLFWSSFRWITVTLHHE